LIYSECEEYFNNLKKLFPLKRTFCARERFHWC